jgi:DNA-binding NarL/FixJ family response regulator
VLAGAETDPAITTDQMAWLRHLASGMTVAELARVAGYSERAMFRLLQSLYRQLGARTRIEAIVRAQEQGWLRPR